MNEKTLSTGISRRTFMKLSGIAAGGAMLAGSSFLLNAGDALADELDLPIGENLPNTEVTYVPEDELASLAAVGTQNGWVKSGLYYYYYVSGKAVTGWRKIDGCWYHFDIAGRMQTGWLADGAHWYYLRKSKNDSVAGPQGAAIVSSWAAIDGYWYRFDGSGAMLIGWQKIDGSYYYLRTAADTPTSGPAGSMCIGWIQVGTRWYYMESSGAMHLGWLQLDGYWYYLGDSAVGITGGADYGSMLRGLHQIGTWKYYFIDRENDTIFGSYPDGAMAVNESYIEILGPDGIIIYATIDSQGHVHEHGIPMPSSDEADGPSIVINAQESDLGSF